MKHVFVKVHISLHEFAIQNKKNVIIFNYTNSIHYNIQNFYIKTYFYARNLLKRRMNTMIKQIAEFSTNFLKSRPFQISY